MAQEFILWSAWYVFIGYVFSYLFRDRQIGNYQPATVFVCCIFFWPIIICTVVLLYIHWIIWGDK